MKTKLILTLALLSPMAAPAQLNLLTNSGFEIPPLAPGPTPSDPSVRINESFVTGWHTTAQNHQIELWESPNAVTDPGRTYTSSSGTGLRNGESQFAEVNAGQLGALFQDVTFGSAGLVDIFFLHRGRLGDLAGQVDTLRLTVLYAGSDGVFSSQFNTATGGYDLAAGESIAYTTLSQANFTDGWKNVGANDVFTSVAGGNYRFAFGAVGAHGNDLTAGNFVDNAFLGFDLVQPPIPEPSTYGALGALVLLGVVAVRRFRQKPADLIAK
jgi:hypothetical protein